MVGREDRPHAADLILVAGRTFVYYYSVSVKLMYAMCRQTNFENKNFAGKCIYSFICNFILFN